MKIYAVVLAAGKGTRMKSDKPKVVHEVLFKPMINHVVDALKDLGVDEIVVVVGHEAEQVKALLPEDVKTVYQREQLGTGHAVLCAKEVLGDKEGMTLVLNGDAPLVQKSTLKGLIDTFKAKASKATVMTAHCDTSVAYGRIINVDGQVKGIVEFKDLAEDQKDITEMNTGEYCFDNQALFNALSQVTNNNAQNEYYLTDVIGIMNQEGLPISSYEIDDFDEVGGINDRVALVEATKTLARRINHEWLLNGVTVIDPDQTYIGTDVTIGTNTVIEPGTIIKGASVIGENCHIGPFVELDHVHISDHSEVKFQSLKDKTI
ncbi:UDP-N-acetylglucosamine diphosphorylase/glucosamine-1-phosphate N-acetyltransferase [Sharpea azabuensis]|nr:UDP-N-acetylglucosamine diphosphorylase/glucosamine-1-phosphate N-acetyltransferase [Sharpea azabuensis]SFK83211.1 UDP-N-acetylglucosamine diphosphorylase/glucosamine-1-phosphate N-acetyltransferase [Sharpea azabuensis]